ncbi:RNA polymerase sigma factor [Candidatus Uhrbacteria bacterium]|nr:RNA polymerase sigma factor [Candidatus Uhrbacteria bacterium]
MDSPSDYAALPDEQLARAVQRGSHFAFRQLVERFTPKLLRYARTFFSSREEQEDVVQEVMIKAYAHIQEFDSRRVFSPWIYRIAHNEFVNVLRKKQRALVFAVDWDVMLPHPISKERTDADILRTELNDTVFDCLKELPEKYREPLLLYYNDDLSYGQISDILHIPVSTVGVRLNRARSMVQAIARNRGITL